MVSADAMLAAFCVPHSSRCFPDSREKNLAALFDERKTALDHLVRPKLVVREPGAIYDSEGVSREGTLAHSAPTPFLISLCYSAFPKFSILTNAYLIC